LEQAEHQRVMLISDTAGMGKSTLLTHLSKQIKQNFPAKWVVRIDLNDHTDALKTLKQEEIGKKKAIEFVSEKVLKLEPGLDAELFKLCCEKKQKVRVVIMLDGFDEISPFYKNTVIYLLQVLRQTAVEQLWVTTRPHMGEELEDKLQQLSYTLEPFSEKNQVEFLTKFWGLKDWFIEPNDKGEERDKRKLEIYAEKLIDELSKSIRDKDRKFTGIPLHTCMLAEAFDEEVKTFYRSAESKPNSQFQLELIELYGRFIQRKYDIYQKEKLQVPVNSAFANEQRERELRLMRKDNQLLALEVLFSEEQVTLFQNNLETFFSVKELTRIGIVQVSDEGKLHFIHRTFAEYYVADYMVNSLTEGNNTSQQVVDLIVKDIFMKGEYSMIRVFMDALLSRSNTFDEEVLKQCGNRIRDLGNDYLLTVYRAVFDCNVNIVSVLLDCLQASRHTEALVQMLLAKDYVEHSLFVFYTQTKVQKLRLLKIAWNWANDKLKPEEINNKLLLAKGFMEKNIFHIAAEWGRLEVLEKVWECANEKLTTEEIKNNLLLAKVFKGKHIFHIAVQWGRLELLQKVWEWANEKLTTEEINNKLFIATDNKGRTVFCTAVYYGRPEIKHKLLEWDRETNNRRDEIPNFMVRPYIIMRYSEAT